MTNPYDEIPDVVLTARLREHADFLNRGNMHNDRADTLREVARRLEAKTPVGDPTCHHNRLIVEYEGPNNGWYVRCGRCGRTAVDMKLGNALRSVGPTFVEQDMRSVRLCGDDIRVLCARLAITETTTQIQRDALAKEINEFFGRSIAASRPANNTTIVGTPLEIIKSAETLEKTFQAGLTAGIDPILVTNFMRLANFIRKKT